MNKGFAVCNKYDSVYSYFDAIKTFCKYKYFD